MILLNLPWHDLAVPLTAPAVLKGIAESHGYKIKTWDSNLDLFQKFCNSDKKKYSELEEYFITDTEKHKELIYKFYQWLIDEIKKEKFNYIGFGVFSVFTQRSTYELIELINKQIPSVKIVLGGKGLEAHLHSSIFNRFSNLEKMLKFNNIIKKQFPNVINIIGEGEDAIIDLLSGNHNNIDQWNEAKSNTLEYPFSNFDDYKLTSYLPPNGVYQIPVISSKGCVRDCDFCDVGVVYKKFQSKTGKRLAEEMIFLFNKYKINNFSISDSIMNGNVKSLKEMIDELIKFNLDKSENDKIKWNGNWISRPAGSFKPEFYKKLQLSGCESLTIGAESGSDHVLEAMNKKTNVAGLYYDLEHFQKNNIKCVLNSIIGHWSEEYSHFIEHLTMLIKFIPYYANNTIVSLHLGGGFSLLKDTPADKNFHENKIHKIGDNFSYLWWSEKNPSLNMKARVARLYIIYKIMIENNIVIDHCNNFLTILKNRLINKKEEIKKFESNVIGDRKITECPSIINMDNWSEIFNSIVLEQFPKSTLEINLEANASYDNPEFKVSLNDEILYNDKINGSHKIVLEFKNSLDKKTLKFEMSNKSASDTIVDSNGNIIKDKNIIFKSVIIDGCDIFKQEHFWFNVMNHYDNGEKLKIGRPGLYSNGSIEFDFNSLFLVDYFKSMKFESPYLNHDNKLLNDIIEDIRLLINNF